LVAGQPAIENLTELLCLNAEYRRSTERTTSIGGQLLASLSRAYAKSSLNMVRSTSSRSREYGTIAARPNPRKRQNADQSLMQPEGVDLAVLSIFSISAQAAYGGAALCTCAVRAPQEFVGGTKKGFS